MTARVRADGGWFGGADAAPDIPADHDVVTEEDLAATPRARAQRLLRPELVLHEPRGQRGHAARAVNGGDLDLPVLFLAARYDYTCECTPRAWPSR